MMHYLLLRHGLPPTNLIPMLLRLLSPRRDFKQPIVQHIRIDIIPPRVPEARRGRYVRQEVRDFLLRDEHAVRDLAGVLELVGGEGMLADDGADAVRADEEVEGAGGRTVGECEVDAGGSLGDGGEFLGELDEVGRYLAEERVLELVALDADRRRLVGVACGRLKIDMSEKCCAQDVPLW